MSDINQMITLGIGTPADVLHFVLVGLNVRPAIVDYRAVSLRSRSLVLELAQRSLELSLAERSLSLTLPVEATNG